MMAFFKRTLVMLVASGMVMLAAGVVMAQNERPALQKMLAEAKSQVTEVSVSQAQQMSKMFPNMVFVDVRTGGEYAAGHVPNAVHLDRGLLEFRAETAIPDKSTKLLVYCKSGARGTLATKTLMDMGYSDVRNLEGGFVAWEERGLPTAQGN